MSVEIRKGSEAEGLIGAMTRHPARGNREVVVTSFAADNNLVRVGYAGGKSRIAVNV